MTDTPDDTIIKFPTLPRTSQFAELIARDRSHSSHSLACERCTFERWEKYSEYVLRTWTPGPNLVTASIFTHCRAPYRISDVRVQALKLLAEFEEELRQPLRGVGSYGLNWSSIRKRWSIDATLLFEVRHESAADLSARLWYSQICFGATAVDLTETDLAFEVKEALLPTVQRPSRKSFGKASDFGSERNAALHFLWMLSQDPFDVMFSKNLG